MGTGPETGPPRRAAGDENLRALRNEWYWFFLLGLLLLLLGAVGLGASFFVTTFTVVMFGVLLVMGGS